MKTELNSIGNWNLTEIYKSFQDPVLNEDIQVCREINSKFNEIADNIEHIQPELLYELLKLLEQLTIYTGKITSYVNLSLLADCNEMEGKTLLEKSNQLQLELNVSSIKTRNIISRIIDLPQLFITYPALLEFKDYIMETDKTLLLYAPLEIEQLIGRMQITGSRAWQRLRDDLESASIIQATIGDKRGGFTLTALRSYAASSDKKSRENAFHEEIKLCKSIEKTMCSCINSIKGEGLATVEMRGYKSVLDWMLGINRMKKTTLILMLDKVKEYLPYFQRYLKDKASILGYHSGLPWFELTAPITKNNHNVSIEESVDLITGIFKDFDNQMGCFYNHVFKEKWVDFPSRPGKAGGALCADVSAISQNRIHINFNGSLNDLRLLSHELGHAFHSRCLDNNSVIMRDPPTPLCETASIFSEIVFQEGMLKNAKGEVRADLIEASVRESTQTIVDIYSRFLFEDELFKRRSDHELSPTELCEMMTSAQKEAYGDTLDITTMHPYMWIPKVHYYIPDFHYYNFPYIFGLLLAKGLYSNYKTSPSDFMGRYRNLLSSSCVGTVEEILKNSGFNIDKPEFWDGAFTELLKDIEIFNDIFIKG